MTDVVERPALPNQSPQKPSGSVPGAGYPALVVRRLGLVDYEPIWRKMQQFTAARTPATPDELWLLQHPAVYTVGLAGRDEHLPKDNCAIPVLKVDRGGQVTFHGPGQIVIYTLIDLRRMNIGIRSLVRKLEQSVIDLLAGHGVRARRREGAPGVYVDGAKIAALGLRIRNGCSFHGLAFNVEMDLAPFSAIDPCGFPGLRVTQACDLGITQDIDSLGENLLALLRSNLEARADEHR